MNYTHTSFTRRDFIKLGGLSAMALSLQPRSLLAATQRPIKRKIPSSNEMLAVVGLGTSGAFDVGHDQEARSQLRQVLQVFFEQGGQLIDSSPMYGTSESVVGDLLPKVSKRQNLFAATKVWTQGREAGIQQMNQSMRRMGVKVMDLMQIHNLVDWKTHLRTLRSWKEQGKIRYLGITTSHGRDHAQFEKIMKSEPLDFVQFTYNIADRVAEERLLPLAADRGIATLINRPFRRGDLFERVSGKPLPAWASDFDCASWGNFFLKFIAGHPSVTCVIPATSKIKHMQDNIQAGFGRLPDPKTRRKMIAYLESV